MIKRKYLFFFASFLFFSSCHLYNLERKLNPVDAEFLSQVRYIITREERKIFLKLPDSEKEKFKEEFWKRRDPDPRTDENEFKMEYMGRLGRANELFIGEAGPGYMTDRGRIYILFGPPEYRETYPMECSEPGNLLYGRCGEIWYYGMFPVVFVDRTCSGSYTLVTYDLTPIGELNLMYMHQLNLAQATAQQNAGGENVTFDFQWKVEKRVVEKDRFEATVIIDIPYNVIWCKYEDKTLKTTLDCHLELEDFEKKLVWQCDRAFEIEMTKEELQEKKNKMYKIEIPLVLEKNLDRIRQGKNLLHVTLKNRTGGEEAKKVTEFKL
jgi:GWxTD domain-containing protein